MSSWNHQNVFYKHFFFHVSALILIDDIFELPIVENNFDWLVREKIVSFLYLNFFDWLGHWLGSFPGIEPWTWRAAPANRPLISSLKTAPTFLFLWVRHNFERKHLAGVTSCHRTPLWQAVAATVAAFRNFFRVKANLTSLQNIFCSKF